MNTLITTYYDNPEYLKKFIDFNFTQDIFDHLIIVDDASPKFPLKNLLTEFDVSSITAYRIKEDIGFNSHAARNLAAVQCETEWATFLDVDHILSSETFDDIYRFTELEEDGWLSISHNQFTIPVRYYLAAGGYDERLNGFWWGDFLFEERLGTLYSYEELDVYSSTLLLKKVDGYPGITRLSKLQEDACLQKELEVKLNTSANPLDWHKHEILTFEWNKICL